MVKQDGEIDAENQSIKENKPISKNEQKKPKIKKEPKQNVQSETTEDKQRSSNAGRPKKNDVKIDDLTFKYSTTGYNISAFSVEFRQQVMCYDPNNNNSSDPQNQYQFNSLFAKFGKKNNKSYFTKQNLDELNKKIEEKSKEYKDETKLKLYNFCENIKLQTDEYYDQNDKELKQLEHSIFDQLFEKIATIPNYEFNKNDFKNIDNCKIILPFFWETIAEIMICEKQDKIYPKFLKLLE
ncbi:hypothetical protein ABPG74_006256 [Tetrahymena malaccensis]